MLYFADALGLSLDYTVPLLSFCDILAAWWSHQVVLGNLELRSISVRVHGCWNVCSLFLQATVVKSVNSSVGSICDSRYSLWFINVIWRIFRWVGLGNLHIFNTFNSWLDVSIKLVLFSCLLLQLLIKRIFHLLRFNNCTWDSLRLFLLLNLLLIFLKWRTFLFLLLKNVIILKLTWLLVVETSHIFIMNDNFFIISWKLLLSVVKRIWLFISVFFAVGLQRTWRLQTNLSLRNTCRLVMRGTHSTTSSWHPSLWCAAACFIETRYIIPSHQLFPLLSVNLILNWFLLGRRLILYHFVCFLGDYLLF